MGLQFIGVRESDKALGFVKQDNPYKPWFVTWADSEIEQMLNVRFVALLGSPKFYELVSPEQNAKHFAEDPVYFVQAYLAQLELTRPPRPLKGGEEIPAKIRIESLDMKKALGNLRVAEPQEINKVWPTVLEAFTKDAKTVFEVKKPEDFKFKVESPWSEFLDSSVRKVRPKTSGAEKAAKTWESNFTELKFASNGQEMGKNFEARAKQFWEFLSEIDETKLTIKEIKSLGIQGSPATRKLVEALKFLAGSKENGVQSSLWEMVLTVPKVDRRQYSKVVELLVSHGTGPSNGKALVGFVIDLLTGPEDILIGTKRLLSEFAAKMVMSSTPLLSSLSTEQVLSLTDACDWKVGTKAELLGKIIKRAPQITKNRDIFLGIERDSLMALEGTELFEVLIKRGDLGELTKGYFETFIRLSNSPAELFGLLRTSSQIPGGLSKELIELAATKAFSTEGVFQEAWLGFTNKALVSSLTLEVKDAKDEILSLKRDFEQTVDELDLAKKYSQRLNMQLSNALEASHQNLGASNDAARLDAARAVAAMAASIYDSAVEDKAEILAIVRPTISRLGIQSTGEPGQEIRFNPEFHTDPEGKLMSGDLGSLVTPGFTTMVGEDVAVLRKAIVSER